MASIEIHLSAEHLLRRHGHDAWAQTVAGAEACAAIGDWEQVGYWRRIGGAVRLLERRGAVTGVGRRGAAYVFSAPPDACPGAENPAFG